MSIRPFRDIKRKKTKEIHVGKVKVGGDNPISVQSMTNTLTTNVSATIGTSTCLIISFKALDEDSSGHETLTRSAPSL